MPTRSQPAPPTSSQHPAAERLVTGPPLALKLRFLAVSVLLRAAQAWAALFRSRLYGRAFGGKTYRIWMASEEFGFDGPFDFPTVAEQPEEEHYPWQLAVSKGLVVMALRIPLHCEGRWGSIAELEAMYSTLGRPEILARAGGSGALPHEWSDEAFLRLRRDGPHAHWVRRELHAAGPRGATVHTRTFFVTKPGLERARTGARRRRVLPTPRCEGGGTVVLDRVPVSGGRGGREPPTKHCWIVDYRELLDGLPVFPGRRLEPCALRWTETAARGVHDLKIQVQGRWRHPGDADWAEARRLFHLAEVHVHEAVSHLLWTHLYSEGVIIAVVQHLAPGHPIRDLLAPHFAFTLQANQNSGKVLLGKGGVFDRLFSCGWAGASELFVRGDAAWRYSRMVPRLDVADRGVEDLADYPWREDTTLVWDVVEAHVRRSLAPIEGEWAARTETGELAEAGSLGEALRWAAAMHAARGDRGWPECTHHEILVEIVTACIFLTVRHTLVNAQQYPMYAYPPLWQASMPAAGDGQTSGDGQTDGPLLAQLPTIGQTLDTMRATFAFSIQFNTLLSTTDEAFRRELDEAGRVIAGRDAGRPHAYKVSHPAVLSASLNA